MINEQEMEKTQGVRNFMHWGGAVISDSGGFQAMSIIKKGGGRVREEGLWFKPRGEAARLLTPEESVRYQLSMQTDLVVVLDDFTPLGATYEEAKETVRRTTMWAKRAKAEFEKNRSTQKPYLIGVVQGGGFAELRRQSARELAEIGFDGYGYGGFPLKNGEFDEEMIKLVAENLPRDVLLYGLGIGKPLDIVKSYRAGYQIFDCVLPTRDGRHGRLYFWKSGSRVLQGEFYKTTSPGNAPLQTYCDCHTCANYSWKYVAHLFRLKETLAYRLATIHNLKFYAELMLRLAS